MSLITLNNRALKNATAVGSITGLGNLVFISRSTASSSSSLSFTSGLTSTYKEYIFMFNNIHPASDGQQFLYNISADGGSNYNIAKQTTYFYVQYGEGGGSSNFGYDTGSDRTNDTGYARIGEAIGNDNDQGGSGYLHIFDPSSTTFVKNFVSVFNVSTAENNCLASYSGGYFNSTSAVNAIDFKCTSSNIDSGTIDMYGVL